MKEWERNFIASHRVARMATIGPAGQPHAVPVVYAFDGEQLFTPIDSKPKRVGPQQLQRVRDIQANQWVAILIDDYDEDWQRLAWVQVRGQAWLLERGEEYESGIELLTAKYPQYQGMPLGGRPVIAIHPGQIVSWRAGQDGSGR